MKPYQQFLKMWSLPRQAPLAQPGESNAAEKYSAPDAWPSAPIDVHVVRTAQAAHLLQAWLRAEADDRKRQHELAGIYEPGDLLPKDIAKAKALYERSAAGGFEPAK